jgi:hypothetical protein
MGEKKKEFSPRSDKRQRKFLKRLILNSYAYRQMKRLEKVNSEMIGGNSLNRLSKRGLSSRDKPLNCGNSGMFFQRSPIGE